MCSRPTDFLRDSAYAVTNSPIQENLFFPLNIYILLKYSWLTMFQVHSKVIQLYIYTYIIFKIIFHYRLLWDIDYSSSCCTVHLCFLLHINFLN